MPYDETMRKVKYDLQRGEVDRAKQRLTGMLHYKGYPSSLEIRRMLGDINYQQGNIIEAGRYWYLEEHKTPEMQSACERFEKACGNKADTILKKIRFQGYIKFLRRASPYAEQLLKNLVIDASADYTVASTYGTWYFKYLSNQRVYQAPVRWHFLIIDANGLLAEIAQRMVKFYFSLSDTEFPPSDKYPYNVTYITSNPDIPIENNDYFFSDIVDFDNSTALHNIIHEAVIKRGRFFNAVVWLPRKTAIETHQFLASFVNSVYRIISPISVADPTNFDANRTRQSNLINLVNPFHVEYVIGFSQQQGEKRWLTPEEIQNELDGFALHSYRRTFIGTVDPSVPRPDEPMPSYYLA